MSRTSGIDFAPSLDDEYQAKEIMAEMRERKIEDIVSEYKATINLALMDEAMHESECTSVMVSAYRSDDFASLGCYFSNRIDEYLYYLAESEIS